MTTPRARAEAHIQAAANELDRYLSDYPLAQVRATLAVAEAVLARVDLETRLWREVEKHEVEDPPPDLEEVQEFVDRVYEMYIHFRGLVRDGMVVESRRIAAERRLELMSDAFKRFHAAIPGLEEEGT